MKKYTVKYDYEKNNYFAISTAEEIVDYLNSEEYDDLDTAISDEVDRKLIYYDDQWEMMRAYQTPQDANYNMALEMFVEELYSIIEEEELEEELVEEIEDER